MADPASEFSGLPSIFDRRRRNHRWLRAFKELEATDPTRRAVCRNWRMDPRVSQSREDELLEAPEHAGEPAGEEWWQRRGEYFQRALCQPTGAGAAGLRSAYLEPSNGDNVIRRSAVPSHQELLHVASLNRILQRVTSAEYLTGDLRLRFPALTGRSLPRRTVGGGLDLPAFAAEIDDLAAAVNGRGLATVRELAGLLVDTLGDTQPPWWAGFAAELLPLIDTGDWAGLCRALGMGHLGAGEWLMVFRYPIAAVYLVAPDARLYRPTVVEADDSPYHFPSPPGYPYGITMPLQRGQRGTCREVVHPPLRGQAAVDACAYELAKIADPPLIDHNELGVLRREHRERLNDEQPTPDTVPWLQRHPP